MPTYVETRAMILCTYDDIWRAYILTFFFLEVGCSLLSKIEEPQKIIRKFGLCPFFADPVLGPQSRCRDKTLGLRVRFRSILELECAMLKKG